MPNKTIYVKDTDLMLLEQAQEQLGESVSSLFAEFLRDRLARLTPEESRIFGLMNRITKRREEIKKETELPRFLDGEFAEAEQYAGYALKSLQAGEPALRAGEARRAKAYFWAANAYYEQGERDVKDIRELVAKMAALLGDKDQLKRSS